MVCGVHVKTPRIAPLGCCANGVTLLSRTVTNPQLSHANLYVHDIQNGRILELHVGGDRLITGISPISDPENRKAVKLVHITTLDLKDYGTWTVPDVCWDPESAWEVDEKLSALRCRLDGLPRFSKSPYYIIDNVVRDTLLERIDACGCPRTQETSFELPQKKKECWSELNVRSFFGDGGTKTDIHEDSKVPEGFKWYIVARAGLRVEDQVAALDCFKCKVKNPTGRDGAHIVRKILSSCASCAFERAMETPDDVNSILRRGDRVSTHVGFIVLAC